MDQDASFHDAKRLYLESCGDPMVTNTYLKIALVLISLVAVGLALVDLRTIRTFQNFRPLVIRIDDLGRSAMPQTMNPGFSHNAEDEGMGRDALDAIVSRWRMTGREKAGE